MRMHRPGCTHAWRPSVRAWPGASVQAWPGASVQAWPGASVQAWPGASVQAWPGASVHAWPGASVHDWPSACLRGDPASERAWGPGASVRDGPHERAGVGTQCKHACMGPASEWAWGPGASKRAWARCMRVWARCVRACAPCEGVRAWIQQARTRACGNPAGTDMGVRGSGKDDDIVIPRAKKHSACKKITRKRNSLTYEPSAGQG